MKTLEWWGSRGHLLHPKVSFLLETHNLSEETVDIAKGLRQYPNAETIIIDDGSTHDHTKCIADGLGGVNEYLLHFNDLFVVLTQNRAVSFARGEYIVKLQDDDVYPGMDWIERALVLFDEHKDLAIIGGRGSVSLPDGWDFSRPLPWRPRCPLQFQFVSMVNEAPMWIRRSDFLGLGGFDQEFAPHYWGEQELCLRAWLSGKSVGWYDSGWRRRGVDLRRRIREKELLHLESWRKNSAIFARNFADKLGYINRLVCARNQEEYL
jgi:GT2 family glycosyltransferase